MAYKWIELALASSIIVTLIMPHVSGILCHQCSTSQFNLDPLCTTSGGKSVNCDTESERSNFTYTYTECFTRIHCDEASQSAILARNCHNATEDAKENSDIHGVTKLEREICRENNCNGKNYEKKFNTLCGGASGLRRGFMEQFYGGLSLLPLLITVLSRI